MQTQIPKRPTFLISCSTCAHIHVCTIYRAIAPLLEKWTEETRPFEADQIASICGEYLSLDVVETLKAGN